MRFKKENWQPTLGDKYDFYVFNKKAVVIDKSKVKICQVGIQASSKHMIEQYRKAKKEYKYDGTIVGETTVELLKDKQLTYRYGDK